MKPKKFQEANVVYGEGQPEYKPLPAHKTKEGQAIFCFELDEAERKNSRNGRIMGKPSNLQPTVATHFYNYKQVGFIHTARRNPTDR